MVPRLYILFRCRCMDLDHDLHIAIRGSANAQRARNGPEPVVKCLPGPEFRFRQTSRETSRRNGPERALVQDMKLMVIGIKPLLFRFHKHGR